MRPSRNQTLIQALGATIKARRLELELSQEDLAGRCELDRPFITLIEAGRKQPTISVLWLIIGGLDWSPSEFMAHLQDRYERAALV